MNGVQAKKDRRRQKRLDRESELAGAERRTRSRRRALATVGVLILVAAVITLIGSGSGGSGSGSAARAADSFGANYRGLDARRTAARVPTMMNTMNSSVHFHARLTIEVDGKPLPVPANLGIDPGQDSMQMAGLHTHDAQGTIHAEGMSPATLGQFFAVWGVPFSASQVGSHRRANVRMWVNGSPSRAFANLKLADRQQIKIAVTTAGQAR